MNGDSRTCRQTRWEVQRSAQGPHPTSRHVPRCNQRRAVSRLLHLDPPMPLNCASQSSCFLCVNGAELAVKLHGKCEEAHTDLTRHRGMSPVTTRPELCHVLSQLRHCFEAIFQLNRAAFYACTGPSMPPNSMGSAMKCTLASSDITAYPPLQPAQSSITFIAHGSPHAAALRRHASSI